MPRLLPAAALLLLASCPLAPPPAAAPSPTASHVDFDSEIKPILQTRCTPCHFPGGVMHARLPFDKAQTIRDLGEKMFTRIKDEQEQELLRSFLAQVP